MNHPLQCPMTRIAPDLDPTEQLWRDVADIAHVFEAAIIDARSSPRCTQLRERISACVQTLTQVEALALARGDALTDAPYEES